MTALSPRRTFSGTALKTIACITMLVDHIGASCIEAGILTPGLDAGTLSQDALSAYPLYRLDMVLRFTGRLAFPLFCFLLVEGFVHTHNVKGYLGRLVLFGLLSEVPFDLAFFRTPFYPGSQNVYWTLALGVLGAMQGRGNGTAFLFSLFLCLAAGQELLALPESRILSQLDKERILRSGGPVDVKDIAVGDSMELGAAMRLLRRGQYTRLLVISRENRLLGIVEESSIAGAAARMGLKTPIGRLVTASGGNFAEETDFL